MEQMSKLYPSIYVEPIRFKDVRGNELLYIKIKKGEKEVLINVGNRTFKNVEELINPKQPELPIETPIRIENGKPTNTPQTQEQLKAKVESK